MSTKILLHPFNYNHFIHKLEMRLKLPKIYIIIIIIIYQRYFMWLLYFKLLFFNFRVLIKLISQNFYQIYIYVQLKQKTI